MLAFYSFRFFFLEFYTFSLKTGEDHTPGKNIGYGAYRLYMINLKSDILGEANGVHLTKVCIGKRN